MKIAVTGSNGFLGQCIMNKLQLRGHDTVPICRNQKSGAGLNFSLATDSLKSEAFHQLGIEGLIHCAWDFSANTQEKSFDINVDGTKKLVDAALLGGVKRFVFISSMSAFDGCQSIYGRSKLAAEKIFQPIGGTVIRPGLIWSDNPGGLVGTLKKLAQTFSVLPLIGDGHKPLHLVHEDDLTELIALVINYPSPINLEYITSAAKKEVTFRDILKQLARESKKDPFFIPIPWQIIFLSLRAAEILRLKLPLRSDSVIGLIKSNQNIIFQDEELLKYGFAGFRDFCSDSVSNNFINSAAN
jgi:nucleoside-diphosphate-sugar epimerase